MTIPAWKTTPSMYLAAHGIHEPWIAEISPAQYAGLSKRGKAAYDEKREAEWEASARGKRAWLEEVIEAVRSGEYDAATASDAARDAVAHVRRVEEKERAERARQERYAANRAVTLDALSVGARVFDVMGGHYAVIVKKNRSTVRLRAEAVEGHMAGREWNAPPSRLWFRSYNDVEGGGAP